MRTRSILMASAALAVIVQLTGCANGTMGMSGMSGKSDTSAQVPANGPTSTAAGGVPDGALVLSGTCNAQAASYAVGQSATQALQSELITKSLAKTLRVVRPGEAVTQEFSSQRLDLDVDSAGRITGVRCG